MKLREIADINSGYLFRSSIKNDKDGDIRVVQLKDVSNVGILNIDELYTVSFAFKKKIDFLKSGDILFKAKSNKHVAVIFEEGIKNVIATSHYFIISVKKADVFPGYLAWYLNQRPAQIYFDKNAGGTRIQVINKQLLGELEVVIPDLKIQEKIAKVYELHQREQNLVDAIKEKKHRLILAQLLSAISK